MNGDMKMELHFVCNLAFIFASLSVTKYMMKVCHSLFAKFVLKVVTKCLSKYHLRDFVTYYLRNIIHETLSPLFMKVYHQTYYFCYGNMSRSLYACFIGCEHLRNLEGLDHWNTSNVNSLDSCFCGCKNLISLNLSHWDTSNIINMWACFVGCESLVYLNIEKWVINKDCFIGDMFTECFKLCVIKCRQDTFNRIKRVLQGNWVYRNGYARKIR